MLLLEQHRQASWRGVFQIMWKLWAIREGGQTSDGRHYAGKGIGWECRDGLVNMLTYCRCQGALLKSPQDIHSDLYLGTGAPSGKNLSSWIFARFIPLFHSRLYSDVTSSKEAFLDHCVSGSSLLHQLLPEGKVLGDADFCSLFSQHGEYCPAHSGHQHTFVVARIRKHLSVHVSERMKRGNTGIVLSLKGKTLPFASTWMDR